MAIIWFSVFIQEDSTRFKAAAIFAAPLLLHDFLFHAAFDSIFYYYISAGIIDLAVIIAIGKMVKYTRLSGDIQIISLVSIVYNFVGWMLFTMNATSEAYSVMYIVLYCWTIYALHRGEPEHGIGRMDTRFFAVRANNFSRRIVHHNH